MWLKRAHSLAPLTKLCYTKVKFECYDVEMKDFMDMKKYIRTRRVSIIP